MSLIRPVENSTRYNKFDDKKNMSFSLKSDNAENHNDDPIYKFYKNNMQNTNTNKMANYQSLGKRNEPDNQIWEISLPIR